MLYVCYKKLETLKLIVGKLTFNSWQLCLPEFSPLAVLIWEHDDQDFHPQTDEQTSKNNRIEFSFLSA